MFQEIHLSQQDISLIHETTVRLLANVGVSFPLERALATFRTHGIRVDGVRVFLTEDQLMDALKTAPACFTLHARNPARDLTVGHGRPVFAPGYGAPFLVDPEVGKRSPTLADYENLVQIVHELPNQDLSGFLLVEPGDVKAGTAHLQMLHAHMIHSDKSFVGSAAGDVGARDTAEMAAILFGRSVQDWPVCAGLINSLSPLGYSSEMLSTLVEYAGLGQPLIVAALAMAGSTGPVTLAGVLAEQNAELLAGIVLAQLINPGTPVIFGSTSTNIDMRRGRAGHREPRTLADDRGTRANGPLLSSAVPGRWHIDRRQLPGRPGWFRIDDGASHLRQYRSRFRAARRRHPQLVPGFLL